MLDAIRACAAVLGRSARAWCSLRPTGLLATGLLAAVLTLSSVIGLWVIGGCTSEQPTSQTDETAADEASTVLDLWAGVPPLEPRADDIVANLQPRSGPIRPDTVTEVVEVPFPAEGSSAGAPSVEPVPEGPVEVERYGPTGEQSAVDTIRVGFNKPMVPLASIEALEAKEAPIVIEPTIDGTAKWLGTRTLAFVAKSRLPQSTTYTVTIPAGTAATDGSTLERDVTWTFTTPALQLSSATPADGASSVDLEPKFVLRFNQDVNVPAVLAALTLRSGGTRLDLKVAPPPEPAPQGDPDPFAGRTLTLVASDRLAPNKAYTLALPPGVYGEGPNRSEGFRITFRTYPPLTLSGPSCRGPCPADQGIQLVASTDVVDGDLASKVHVEPEVDNLAVSGNYRGISVTGDFEGEQTYQVTVDAGVTDRYGQTLARPYTKRVRLGPLSPRLYPLRPGLHPGVIEKDVGATMALRVQGLNELQLEGEAFGLSQLRTFFDARSWGTDYSWPDGLPGPTLQETRDVSASRKQAQTLQLDLKSMTSSSQPFGRLQIASEEFQRYGSPYRESLIQLFSVTDLGITAAMDQDDGVVLVTRLSDGMPVPAASVQLLSSSGGEMASGVTDAMGVAHLAYPNSDYPRFVTVRTDDDQSFLTVDRNDLRGTWMNWGLPDDDRPRAFFFTDRTPYKPGETIHLVGVLRHEEAGPYGGVKAYRTAGKATWRLNDARGIEVATGETDITPFGTVAVDLETTEEHGTGDYSFVLTVPNLFGSDQTFYHSIPVETYRAPEFKVSVKRETSVPLTFGDALEVDVLAEYLHGAPMQGAAVAWTLSRADSGFRPPSSHNEGFSFGSDPYQGRWRPGRHGYWGSSISIGSRQIDTGDGATGPKGTLTVSHRVAAVDPPPEPAAPAADTEEKDPGPPRAATYILHATVTDENRQQIASSGSFVVHPSEVYVGLRSEKTVVRQGERARVEVVLVDLQGERLSKRDVTVQLVREITERRTKEVDGRPQYTYESREEIVDMCQVSSRGVPVDCEFAPAQAGTYTIRGLANDDEGRLNRTQTTLYVYGEDAMVWDEPERRVDVVPDRSSYEPGQEAAVLVRSPFEEAMGFVVVEREGMSRRIPIVVKNGATAVQIPITETMMPKVTISAVLSRGRTKVEGSTSAEDLGMPAAAAGQADIEVSTAPKRIEVELEPSTRELDPKGTLSLRIHTKDGAGKARPASVAVMVVDEGVLSLMGHETPDPLAFFHRSRQGNVWLGALHQNVLPRHASESEGVIGLGDIGVIGYGGGDGEGTGYGRGSGGAERKPRPTRSRSLKAKSAPAPAADMPMAEVEAEETAAPGDGFFEGRLDTGKAMAQSVSLRTLFATTAFFDADIRTDENGEASIDIEMPENLTTFRIMAVAVDPEALDRFGSAETTVRVRKPLMLRPSMPRFATFGDAFEASVMVDNQTGSAQEVLVGMRGLNMEMEGPDQKLVKVPAGESTEVRFDVSTMAVGTMRVQFAAMSNEGRDATELSLPVNAPAVAEAFADYGMTDDSVRRLVEPPADALPGFGGLELSFSSTALSGLEDAVQYLVDYEYECAEQTASRVLPIFVLGEILDDFPIAGIRQTWQRKQLAEDGIARLLEKQGYDGGFGYWKSDESWPYLTNWVTFALLEGKRAGFEVDASALSAALSYVENFVRHGHRTRWGVYYDWTSRAFGLWLLSREGKGEGLFDTVWAHRNDVPLYARAMLMSAAHRYGKTTQRDEVLEELREAVIEDAKTIHFEEARSEAAAQGLAVLMHSNVQTDAIVLMALLEVAPTDPMLPKIIAGIMAERDPRRGGRWSTTHANAWALLSASRYYETVESDEPDFVAKIWLDQQFGGEIPFQGRSMAKVQQTVPMAELLGKEERSLTVAKEGTGKLYYRLGLSYAPKSFELPARDRGFTVYRTYEALDPDDEGAVSRLDDGSWQVKAGSDVKVTIHVVARNRANYVVIDDALPAGFEGQNPRFATVASGLSESRRDPGHSVGGWWYPWWRFDHVDMRDDRVLLFADHMPAGVYTYAYTARATTLGNFKLPPVKAEEMYEPETFGHSSSSVVRVVD